MAACSPAQQPAALERSPAGLDQVQTTVTTADGKRHVFITEVARTLEQQQRGLMFRESLAPDHGMIFPYDPPKPQSFWMRNTLIPLDLIFVGADGRILNVEANAVPLSEEPIGSAGDAALVFEIPGGRAAELGIKAGDKVDWPR